MDSTQRSMRWAAQNRLFIPRFCGTTPSYLPCYRRMCILYPFGPRICTTIGSRSDELGDLGPEDQLRTIAKVREVIAHNPGLLLVAVSQFFFALVHAAAKKMNSSETPVPVLEVCLEVRMCEEYPKCFFLGIARICPHGELRFSTQWTLVTSKLQSITYICSISCA